jgi:hypothetical protein
MHACDTAGLLIISAYIWMLPGAVDQAWVQACALSTWVDTRVHESSSTHIGTGMRCNISVTNSRTYLQLRTIRSMYKLNQDKIINGRVQFDLILSPAKKVKARQQVFWRRFCRLPSSLPPCLVWWGRGAGELWMGICDPWSGVFFLY